MLCHSQIIVAYPEIAELREHYDERRPIEWVPVFHTCDFVYFNHEPHVRRGIDCGQCHGDIRHMDRIAEGEEMDMGFCVQCHRDNGASHDCLACHR
jgi:hypothetical protein